MPVKITVDPEWWIIKPEYGGYTTTRMYEYVKGMGQCGIIAHVERGNHREKDNVLER